MRNDFENEVVTVEEQHGYKVFFNFKGEELLRVKKEFYPWLENYFTGHLLSALQVAKVNMEDMTRIIDNQLSIYEDKDEV